MNKVIVFCVYLCCSTLQAQECGVARNICNDEFGLSRLTVNIRPATVEDQSDFSNEIRYPAALRLALHSFLTDSRDREGPYALTLPLAFKELHTVYERPVPRRVHRRNLSLLQDYINRPSSRLTLLSATDESLPPRGEGIADYWIFMLYIPDLSDHMFYALVHREGKKPVYNYGFN